jgi:hypothetical protein
MQRIVWGISIIVIAALAGCGGGGGGAVDLIGHSGSLSTGISDEIVVQESGNSDQAGNVEEPPSPPSMNASDPFDAPPPPPF